MGPVEYTTVKLDRKVAERDSQWDTSTAETEKTEKTSPLRELSPSIVCRTASMWFCVWLLMLPSMYIQNRAAEACLVWLIHFLLCDSLLCDPRLF